MKELKGSEKQIAWAEKIRASFFCRSRRKGKLSRCS